MALIQHFYSIICPSPPSSSSSTLPALLRGRTALVTEDKPCLVMARHMLVKVHDQCEQQVRESMREDRVDGVFGSSQVCGQGEG